MIRAYSGFFTHIFHCLSCVIIYGFTISNPCQKTQHVEIVAITCGLTSQMLPITLQGNKNGGYFETNDIQANFGTLSLDVLQVK